MTENLLAGDSEQELFSRKKYVIPSVDFFLARRILIHARAIIPLHAQVSFSTSQVH